MKGHGTGGMNSQHGVLDCRRPGSWQISLLPAVRLKHGIRFALTIARERFALFLENSRLGQELLFLLDFEEWYPRLIFLLVLSFSRCNRYPPIFGEQ